MTDARFRTPISTTNSLYQHKVIIVTPTSNVGSIMFDNASISSEFVSVGSGSGYSYVYKAVSEGNHHIHSSSDSTFVAYSFGFGTRVSYGYSIGLSARNLRRPDIHVGERTNPVQVSVCQGDSLSFFADTSVFSLHQIAWSVQEADTSLTTNPATISFPDTGTYHVCAYMVFMSGPSSTDYRYDTVCTTVHVAFSGSVVSSATICENALPYIYQGHTVTCDTSFVTLDTTGACPITEIHLLRVADTVTVHADTSVCQSSLPIVWNGITFSGDSTAVVMDTDINLCDSITYLQLSSISNDTAYLDTTVCSMDLPYSWYGITFGGDSTTMVVRSHPNLCDSVIYLHLLSTPNDTVTTDTSVCSMHLPYRWHGMNIEDAGVYYYLLPVEDGCDTVYRLTFAVTSCNCDDSVAIWAPNVFTPSQETNKEFRVFTRGITEARMVIYQRWGDYVTELDALTQSWDGTKDGRACKQDAYVYKIFYRTICSPNEHHTKTGTVLLVR